jgi:hypothetical protein
MDLVPNKIRPRKTERKKNCAEKKIPGRNSPRPTARPVERHSLAVYSGTIWLGSIEQVGDEFTAKTIRGKKIAIFGNLKAAADAVSATAEAA